MRAVGPGRPLPQVDAALRVAQKRLVPGAPRIERSKIDRYVLIERLAAGGNGVVYTAYDPILDRKVALKMLQRTGVTARARLMREAHTLAQLSHPNVVPIYDAGTFSDDNVPGASELPGYEPEADIYLVMELVEGMDLAQWLGSRPRRLEAIRNVFLAAGRGLAAAHEAGVVHRDFKPANVLLGADGRARVADFGLARAVSGGQSAESGMRPRTVTGSPDLTTTGMWLGTPAYMAPEQFAGTDVDAKADQFSFCVAFFEAVFGRRPFAGDSIDEVRRNILMYRILEPPRRGVPRRLRKTIMRGLSRDPKDRYPSMTALLADLGPEKASMHRWFPAGVLLGSVAAIAGVIVTSTDPCPPADPTLAGLWSRERISSIEARFAEVANGTQAWAEVAPTLDAYINDLASAELELCEAREVPSSTRLARASCLELRRDELVVLLDLWEAGDQKMIAAAERVVSGLGSLDECREARAPKTDLPTDPGVRAQVASARSDLVRARLLDQGAKYEEAWELTASIVESARELGYDPLLAEALMQQAEIDISRSDFEAARARFAEAFWTATSCSHDQLAARAANHMLIVLGDRLGHLDEAREWGKHALAAFKRAGEGPELESDLFAKLGVVELRLGNYDEAERMIGSALELRRQIPESDVKIGALLNSLGVVAREQRKFELARERIQEGLDLARFRLGDEHPVLAYWMLNLAVVAIEVGDLDTADEHIRTARALRVAAMGPDHASLANVFFAEGRVALARAQYEDADKAFARALELTGPSAEGRMRIEVLTGMGQARTAHGEHARALEALGRAEELRTEVRVAPDIEGALDFALARAHAAAGNRERAGSYAESARRELSKHAAYTAELAELDRWASEALSAPAEEVRARSATQ